MGWNAAIDKNREALKRVLAMLVAMAGITLGDSPPLRGRCPAGQRGVPGSTVDNPPLSAPPTSPPQGGRIGGNTLPRHLYRAILRLLRPAEAAARRLIIVAARGLEAALPRQRPCKLKPAPTILRNGVGAAADSDISARGLGFPLFDPLRRWQPRRPRPAGVPRICFPGLTEPFPVPVRTAPTPFDPIDATRLTRRIAALARALDDLPRQARRFARWRASFKGPDSGRIRRIRPLRPGRPPGQRPDRDRRSRQEIHDILETVHGLALWAQEPPDTS